MQLYNGLSIARLRAWSDDRFGSKREELELSISGLLLPSKADIIADLPIGRECHKRPNALHQTAPPYSITSSARSRSVGGTSKPSIFSAFRFDDP